MWFGFFMCHLHNEKDESISAWNEYSALSLLNHSSHNHKHVFELEVLFFYWHLHDTFGSRIIKIQTWVISILLHHSKMRENIWSKVENLELYKRTDLSKPQNQKQTFTHTSFLERRWRILSVIIGVAPDCAREGYYIDTRFWSKISKESFIACSTQQFFIAIQFLMKMNEGRIQHHTCKEFVLLLLSKDQMCTHD